MTDQRIDDVPLWATEISREIRSLRQLIESFRERAGVTMFDVKGVARHLGISPRSVWRLVASGSFPAPVKIGANLTRWRRSDVENALGTGAQRRVLK